MRGRVFLTAEYHRDTGALTHDEAVEAAQHWTYRGDISRSPGWAYISDATVCYSKREKKVEPYDPMWDIVRTEILPGDEEACPDIVLPSHSVRLIEVGR